MKRCPQCGQRTANIQLAECPYCRVALVTESGGGVGTMSPEQARAVARQLLGSWKLWFVVLVFVGAAAWGVVQISQRVIDSRAKDYLRELDERATNRLAVASAQISRQVSSQIESEFQQPRVQAAIEQVAKQRVNEALTNSIWPTVDGFRQSADWARGEFASFSNNLARLDRDVKAAQRRLTQLQAQEQAQAAALAQTPAPSAPSNAPANTPVTVAPGPSGTNYQLTLANQMVSANGANYILTVFFNQVRQNLGFVNMEVGILRQSGAKIVAFGLVSAGQSQPMTMNDTQDAARFSFNIAAGDNPTVAVEVTGPTIVQLSGDDLPAALTFPVAADKLLHPTPTK